MLDGTLPVEYAHCVSQADLMVVREHFFAAVRGQSSSCSMTTQSRYNICYIYSRKGETGAHNVNAADGHEYLLPPETCTLAHVTVEGSGPSGSSRLFHLRIWLGNQNGRACPSIGCGPGGPLYSVDAVVLKARHVRKPSVAVTM